MRLIRMKAAAASIVCSVRVLFKLFVGGGPVGVYYTLRLAYLRRRLARVSLLLTRERDLHREHLAALNYELNGLVADQQETHRAAAEYWRAHAAPGAQS